MPQYFNRLSTGLLILGFVVAAAVTSTTSLTAAVESRDQQYASGTPAAETSPIQVVAWGAQWCKYCRRDHPELERLAKTGKYVILYYDFDENRELARQYNITSLPTYMVVRDGKVVFRTHSINALKAYKPPRK